MTELPITAERLCPLAHRVDPERPRKSAPSSILCDGHISQSREKLEQLPRQYVELATIAAPTYEKRSGARSAEKPIPYRENAADHRELIVGTVVAWARNIAEERDVHLPERLERLITGPHCQQLCSHRSCLRIRVEIADERRGDVDRACEFLRRHHDWAVTQPWADDYATELRDLSERAWSILHPRGVRRVDVPVPCPICAGPLIALVGEHDAEFQRDDLAPPTVQCDGCGAVIPFADAQRAAKTDDRMVTWEVAVLWAQVQHHHRLPASTLRTWAERGWVKTKRRDSVVLYSLRAVEKILVGERVA
jgi:hypothetical protein